MALETQASSSASEPEPTAFRSASARDRLSNLFPDPSARAVPWWRRRRRAIATVIVVALIVSGGLAATAFGASGVSYRTASVGTHDVDALLNGVATIEPVSQASVAFPAGGTVASVNVKIGDSVAIGQALASLDPQELTQALHEKQAALAQAQLRLEQALNGEAVSGGGSNPIALTAAVTPSAGGTGLHDAQQAVLDAQKGVDAALHTATNALDSAATVCAAAGVGTTTSTPATTDQLTACQTATKAVLSAQTAVSTAQQQLADAAKALDALLAQQATAPPSGSTGSNGSTGSTGSSANGNRADGGNGSGQSNGTGSTSNSPSSADLVAYQKAVDAAAAGVAVAEQAIAQGTIVSPIAGTVQGVTLTVGDQVDAGSTTANVVVVGGGGFEATTTVSVDNVTDVKVGQKATLLPDGSKQVLTGTVSSISISPDAGSTTTSYRVVIGLDDPNASLDNGSTGSVSIVTESSRAGLAVPTSAVTTIGSRHTVTVLDGSTTTRVPVEVGVVGETWTEITSGVTAGQEVVIADLSQPLPGSATQSSGNASNGQLPGGAIRFGGPAGFGPGAGPAGK